jgi:hypothetical protein
VSQRFVIALEFDLSDIPAGNNNELAQAGDLGRCCTACVESISEVACREVSGRLPDWRVFELIFRTRWPLVLSQVPSRFFFDCSLWQLLCGLYCVFKLQCRVLQRW